MDIGANQEALLGENITAILGHSAAALIDTISERAQVDELPLYLVGGVVRDLLLGRRNLDLDFVVEGDAAELAHSLACEFGGSVHIHPPFGTAKWELDELAAAGMQQSLDLAETRIDFASAREETYPSPAALPQVTIVHH